MHSAWLRKGSDLKDLAKMHVVFGKDWKNEVKERDKGYKKEES